MELQQNLHHSVAVLLQQAIAKQGPLLFVLDNVHLLGARCAAPRNSSYHCADTPSLRLLEHVQQHVERALFVVSADTAESLLVASRPAVVELPPLSAESIGLLCSKLLNRELALATRDGIVQCAGAYTARAHWPCSLRPIGGCPLFVFELVASVRGDAVSGRVVSECTEHRPCAERAPRFHFRRPHGATDAGKARVQVVRPAHSRHHSFSRARPTVGSVGCPMSLSAPCSPRGPALRAPTVCAA